MGILEAFDPELRKELGVWYTPPEIVRYMADRVDQLLRTELRIEDGRADDSVYISFPLPLEMPAQLRKIEHHAK